VDVKGPRVWSVDIFFVCGAVGVGKAGGGREGGRERVVGVQGEGVGWWEAVSQEVESGDRGGGVSDGGGWGEGASRIVLSLSNGRREHEIPAFSARSCCS